MNTLDTNSIMEIMKGNPSYAHLINSPFVLTDQTLAEVYMEITKAADEEQARYWYKKLSVYSRPVGNDILIKALKFKASNPRISYIDAANFIFARENNYKYITSSKLLEKKSGVEFIE